MAGHAVVEHENPLSKFDAPTLKNMGSQIADAGAPRTMFLPATMGEAMEVAKLMAAGNFVPPHLRGRAGDCLAVVMQSARWGMDPFAVGNKTYFVNDRMAYESQLVNAVINSAKVLDGRLHPEWEGEGNDLVCTVTGRLRDDPEPKVRRVPIKNITTRNSPLWKQDPEQQLGYYAMRAWVRLHAPEVLLGVYTPEEVAQMEARDGGEVSAKPLTSAMLVSQAKAADPTAEEQPRETSLGDELNDSIPALDPEPNDGTFDEQENPTAEEGPAQEQLGEADDDTPAWMGKIVEMRGRLSGAKNHVAVNGIEQDWLNLIRPNVPDDHPAIRAFESDLAKAKAAYPQKKGR